MLKQQRLNGMSQFFGVPTSDSSEVIIEDKYLRKTLIEAAMKAEALLQNSKIDINRSIVSKPNQWGLMVETNMEQPRPNKPVVYKFKYRLDIVIYNQWLEEHSYMLGDEGCLVFTSKRGIKVIIMPELKKQPVAQIVVKYGEHGDKEYNAEISLKSLNFSVHREVISMHDWIVKCIVE